MNAIEEKMFRALDDELSVDQYLAPRKQRLYRRLAEKHLADAITTLLRGGRVSSPSPFRRVA